MQAAILDYSQYLRSRHNAFVLGVRPPSEGRERAALATDAWQLLTLHAPTAACELFDLHPQEMSVLFYVDGPLDVGPIVAFAARRRPGYLAWLMRPQAPYKCNLMHHACKAGAVRVVKAFMAYAPELTKRALCQRNTVGLTPVAFCLFAEPRQALMAMLLPALTERDICIADIHGNSLFANICLFSDNLSLVTFFASLYPDRTSPVYGSRKRRRALAKYLRGTDMARCIGRLGIV